MNYSAYDHFYRKHFLYLYLYTNTFSCPLNWVIYIPSLIHSTFSVSVSLFTFLSYFSKCFTLLLLSLSLSHSHSLSNSPSLSFRLVFCCSLEGKYLSAHLSEMVPFGSEISFCWSAAREGTPREEPGFPRKSSAKTKEEEKTFAPC